MIIDYASYDLGYAAGAADGKTDGYTDGWQDAEFEYEPKLAELQAEILTLEAQLKTALRGE